MEIVRNVFYNLCRKQFLDMSEKRKIDQLSEEELEERETVAADFFAAAVKIRNAEARLKRMKADQKALLARYPYLGNAVGALHKGGTSSSSQSQKKQKKDEDVPMKDVPKTSQSGGSPKERIALRLAQKAGEAAQSARRDQEAELKERQHDKP